MNEGWLWLSILNTTACPSPTSITPAFSPGPWITHGAFVGSPLRWMREDLYEQCSFHIAEKMPSSVNVGTRPISFRMRSYSSGLRPCEATSSGVILGWLGIMMLKRDLSLLLGTSSAREKGFLRVFSTIRGIAAMSLPAKHLHHAPGSDLTALALQPKAFFRGRSHQYGIPAPPRPACRNRGRI